MLNNKRERSEKEEDASSYKKKLLDMLNNELKSDESMMNDYVDITSEDNENYQIYLKVIKRKFDVNELSIIGFVDLSVIDNVINSPLKAYMFYKNIDVYFEMFSMNTNDENDIINKTREEHKVGITKIKNDYYIFAHRSIEFCFNVNFQFLVLINNCDFVLIKIVDYDIFHLLVEKQMKIELTVIERSVREKYHIIQKEKEEFDTKFDTFEKTTQKELCDKEIKIKEYKRQINELNQERTKLQIQLDNIKNQYKTFEIEKKGITIINKENEFPKIESKNLTIDDVEFEQVNIIYKKEVEDNDNQKNAHYLCSFCLEKERNLIFSQCGHCFFCFDCLKHIHKKGPKYECPYCKRYSRIQKIIYP